MGILNKFWNKKNKFVQPKVVVTDTIKEEVTLLHVNQTPHAGCTYNSTWFSDPTSSTGRKYRVQVTGPYGRVDGYGETMAVAIAKANKQYEKRVK